MSGHVDSQPLPNDNGDAWVTAPDGRKFWGTFGASGLLAVDPDRGVLLQHRVEWSHFGGTWALPGGARHRSESPVQGAFREAAEEAGVPEGACRVRFTSVVDLGVWSYTTVVADVVTPFEAVISDPESLALEWVPVDEVDALPLHPGFAAAWPGIRAALAHRPRIVVDAANVVGARPNGWWKDRAGAAERLLSALDALAGVGVSAAELDLPHTHWWPRIDVVLEGQAKAAAIPGGALHVELAPGEGDDEIVRVVREDAGSPTRVVTADRGLSERVIAAGARTLRPSWLWEHLDAVADTRA